MKEKPSLSFWQIWNMSFGFMGIQFGWALQMANMGPIYEYLGADAGSIPLLFLAAPLTGFIVQPIIGYLSDHTWHPRWGRRRPYFLIGAVLSSLALIAMPNSSALWMAAGLLWILDTSINISMEPFRAFVTDRLPDSQSTKGFAMQSFFIGLGSVIASALPWMMSNWLGLSNTAVTGSIPDSVKFSFYIGAFAFILAVLYTVFTTREYPPDYSEESKEVKNRNITSGILQALKNMPPRMKQLAWVQFFTWPGLFLMWFYYSSAVARNVFGAVNEQDPAFAKGLEFAGLTLAFYNLVTFLVALMLPMLAKKIGRRYTHLFCLFCGAAGLLSVAMVTQPYYLFLSMTGVGIAWAGILSMPYSMLSGSLPASQVGIYMGIFNFFIVLPEIIASLGFGWIMENVLHNNRMHAVMLGGFLMLLAGLLCLRVEKSAD